MSFDILKKINTAAIKQRFLNKTNLHKIIRNATWLIIDKIFRMGMALFVGVWIARYLGPEEYGQWNYAIAFSSLFGVFASLGLDEIVVRELIRNPQRNDELLGTTFILKLAASLISVAVSALAIFYVKQGDKITLLLVLICGAGLIFQTLNTIDFYFQSQLKSKYTVYAQNIAYILTSLLKVYLLLTKASLLLIATTGIIEMFLGSLFLATAYKLNHMSIKSWKFNSQIAVNLVKESWPLILSSFAIIIYMRVDQIMLGQMLGDKDVGLYSAAVKLSEMWYFIPMSISASIYPALIAAKETDESRYTLRAHQIFILMLLFSVPIAIFIGLTSNNIIGLLYGTEYKGAGSILTTHIWAGVPIFIGIGYARMFLIEGFIKVSFYLTLLSAIVNILLNFLFIPIRGALGAALATTLTQFFALFLRIVYLHIKCKIFSREKIGLKTVTNGDIFS